MSGAVKIRDRDDPFKQAIIDGKSGAQAIMEYEHYEIHNGDHYFIDDFNNIPNTETYEVIIKTPNTTKQVHFVFEYYYESEGAFQMYENVATTDDGSTISSFNSDRNSDNTASLIVTHSPTGVDTASASLMVNHRIGSGKGIGGTRRADQEKILKRNTKYWIVATNYALGASNLFNYQFDWYEHIPKIT
jgi:hypothetical protein